MCVFVLNSEEICGIDFSEEIYLNRKEIQSYYENKRIEDFQYLSFDELESFNKYDILQVYQIINDKTCKYQRLKAEEYLNFIYKSENTIEKNGMILTKVLVYKDFHNDIYPGICVYMNFEKEYGVRHVFINNKSVRPVFDCDGNMFYMVIDSNRIRLFEVSSIDITNGGLYDYYYTRLFINYIDEGSKQVRFYDIYSGKGGTVLQLPPLYKPELYWGYDTKELETLDHLGLVPVKTENKVNEEGFVYRQVIEGRNWEGHVYKRDTVYLVDYNFDGTRKKGIYKLMGDTFEFFPDL